MNKTCLFRIALLPFLMFSGASFGESAADAAARITATLQSRFPQVKIERVNPARQLPGYYEVVTPDEIVYTDANADFLIAGRIMDTRTHENLTAKRWDEINAIDFNSLPLDLAIKTVRGDGSRRVAVFSDPDCPYCRQLEQEMQGLANVTIYTFLFPLESLHPQAREKSVKIWCSSDRAGAWSEWMLKHVAPPGASCQDEPIAKLLELGVKLKVNSTPTVFFADGSRVNGALRRAQLEQRFITGQSGK